MTTSTEADARLMAYGPNVGSCQSDYYDDNRDLIFHRYGDQYFLHQVWTPGSERGGQLSESRIELELAKSASEVQRVSIIAAR